MRDKSEYCLFVLLGFFVRLMPLRAAQRFAVMLAYIAYHLIHIRKSVTIDNLKHAFPEKEDSEINRIAYGAYRNLFIAVVELLWFPRFSDKKINKTVRVRNIELAHRAYNEQKGLIVLSAHFGNWELLAMAGARIFGRPFTIIVQGLRNRYVGDLINKYRCLYGNQVVDVAVSVREILKALYEKRVVAMVADQSAGAEGPFVELFGRPASTHLGPALFSLRSGAPLQMGFMIRQKDGTYEIAIEEVDKTGIAEYTQPNALELTRRHVAILEKYVRQYPDHWLWQHRKWKHAPRTVKSEETKQ
jgi:KDO2-lipid IV(A) lauroyltransferase